VRRVENGNDPYAHRIREQGRTRTGRFDGTQSKPAAPFSGSGLPWRSRLTRTGEDAACADRHLLR